MAYEGYFTLRPRDRSDDFIPIDSCHLVFMAFLVKLRPYDVHIRKWTFNEANTELAHLESYREAEHVYCLMQCLISSVNHGQHVDSQIRFFMGLITDGWICVTHCGLLHARPGYALVWW